MNNETKIIKLSPEKWKLYKEIRLKALREEPQAFNTSLDEAKTYKKEKWVKRASSPFNFAAVIRKKPVGTISCYITEENSKKVAHIVGVFVLNNFRRKKIGYKLFNTLLDKIKEDKTIEKAELYVNKKQEAAINMYKKLGFKISGEKTSVMGDGLEHEEHKMTLDL